ncbi:hypothetical protein [Aneurinibacillus aneurinilyticus]|uniref:Uncharacterized protein n=1 Tax=Aneurinibacillus aneurinilyticus ATCC 12856 TaxID=649747 RepID=U1XZK1_ANEAE|nr:hypothetical protein [Aneurinibacillus aneurinilyticus]ERI05407.1 hypothetical protein HMPREF0083_05690 [Aneurinibacillus aneurinilyticus ATCC 12856]MED0704884.1 hypothetical protein [Aneurinibacillus aneurinilyticus]MED0724074.1 hypothetical protein [Aneurinibacillus aneurinilyticus]MED0731929.1 hypothetical protein [Aneurinibacillus aneurinilyticus]MED0741541.1 hypothetical protein [Aneurinibacillus aneurinilyticus]
MKKTTASFLAFSLLFGGTITYPVAAAPIKKDSKPVQKTTPEQQTFKKWTVNQAIDQFKKANLEVGNHYKMTKKDYGYAPMVAIEAERIFIPSLGEGNGGRIYSFNSKADLEKMKKYYESFGKENSAFFSWVLVKDNILFQINGKLPEEKAKKYQAVLNSLGTNTIPKYPTDINASQKTEVVQKPVKAPTINSEKVISNDLPISQKQNNVPKAEEKLKMTDDEFEKYLNDKYGNLVLDGKTIGFEWKVNPYNLYDIDVNISGKINNDDYSSWLNLLIKGKKDEIKKFFVEIANETAKNYENKKFSGSVIYQDEYSFYPTSSKPGNISVTIDGNFLVTKSIVSFYNFGNGTKVDID